MIAAQMLACHDAAMARFRDALNSKLHGRLWHEYLEQAGKLSRTFAMLLDAHNRHRGKGTQKRRSRSSTCTFIPAGRPGRCG
jgi:hypothetical protein